MRQIKATAFVTLDGVMQAPGGPEEDTTGGFQHGGWSVPYWDDVVAQAMGEVFAAPFELLLGRRTYDVFAAHWPLVPTDPTAAGYDPGEAEGARMLNEAVKHVATRSPTTLGWANSRWLGADVSSAVRELKRGDGPDLLVQGSSMLLQALLAHDLLDEIRLLVYPVAVGTGKRFFGAGTSPGAFQATQSTLSPSGVVITTYTRAGAIRTGSFALAEPASSAGLGADD